MGIRLSWHKSRSRGIHNLQTADEHLVIGNLVKADGVGALDGILVVDAVDLGGLNQNLGTDLAGAKGRGGVSRKVRITRSGGKDNDVALGQVVDGATANIGLADLVHLDGAHHAAGNIVVLEGILQGKRVHNGCQHAHVIGLGAVHATGSAGHAAENVAAADNDADLMANGEQLLDLLGKMVGNLGVDAIVGRRPSVLRRKASEARVYIGCRTKRSSFN